jgi:phage gp29-like protein
MGSAGWAAFPAGTTLELKADGMRNGSDTPQGDILDRADKQCDLLVLGQTLTSDTGGGGKGGGSLALGKVHEGVKGQIIQAAANFAESVIENQLIPSILRLNYGDDDERPSIRLESEEEDDLQADSQIVKTLVDAGAGEIVGLDWLGKKFNAEVKVAWEAGYVSTPASVKGGITYRNNKALKEFKKLKK